MFIVFFKKIYTNMHKDCINMHKKSAYYPYKGSFFLRPFYVFSTSFLRNGYMEVAGLYKLHILCIKKAVRQELPDCPIKIPIGFYSAIRSSIMVQADLATLVPGPKIAATPAL